MQQTDRATAQATMLQGLGTRTLLRPLLKRVCEAIALLCPPYLCYNAFCYLITTWGARAAHAGPVSAHSMDLVSLGTCLSSIHVTRIIICTVMLAIWLHATSRLSSMSNACCRFSKAGQRGRLADHSCGQGAGLSSCWQRWSASLPACLQTHQRAT